MNPAVSAKQKLVHYFEQLFVRAGLVWREEQIQEVESIVDDIVAAASDQREQMLPTVEDVQKVYAEAGMSFAGMPAPQVKSLWPKIDWSNVAKKAEELRRERYQEAAKMHSTLNEVCEELKIVREQRDKLHEALSNLFFVSECKCCLIAQRCAYCRASDLLKARLKGQS